MRNISSIIVNGNLTKDPDSKVVGNSKTLAEFTIAVNHSKEDVSFFEVQAWEKLEKLCMEYLQKGSKVTIQGSLRQKRWKSPDGESRSKIIIIAHEVYFDSAKKEPDGYE